MIAPGRMSEGKAGDEAGDRLCRSDQQIGQTRGIETR